MSIRYHEERLLMEPIPNLTRPTTFQTGRAYLCLDDLSTSEELALPLNMIPVYFIAYDVCPAYVIVKNGRGERRRCLRNQIYEMR